MEKDKSTSVDVPVPEGFDGGDDSEGMRSVSRIRNWGPVEWEKYTALEVTRHLVNSGIVTKEDFLFRLQV